MQTAEATLHGHAQSQTFTEVRCQITPLEHGLKTAVEFRIAGVGMPSPAQIQITRNRQSDPPTTRWEVRTGPSPLPCALFAGYCPSLARLGPDCCFQGTLWAEQAASGWNGELAGRFQHVELERWLEPFPHKLTGTAELVFSEATFRNDRLRTASGSLHCPGGVLSNSLLAAFAKAFQLEVAPREAAEEEPLREYQQLACGFQFDAQGMRVSGLCPGEPPGVILADRQGPLVLDSPASTVPAVALAQALSPDNALHVPATEEAHWLLQALPLPTAEAPAEITAERRPYTPLRLRKQ